METKFNFKSQPCTSREQSERLLALGLKTETADMNWCNASVKGKNYQDDWQLGTLPYYNALQVWDNYAKDSCWQLIPAWSLHRLIEMRLAHDPFAVFQLNNTEDAFEKVISHIEHAIKEGYFNKEYLV